MLNVTLDGVPQTLDPVPTDHGTIVFSNSSLRIEVSAPVFALMRLPEIEDPIKGVLAVALVEAEVRRVIQQRVEGALEQLKEEKSPFDHLRAKGPDEAEQCSGS